MKRNATKVAALSLSAILAAGGLGNALSVRAAEGQGVQPAFTAPMAVSVGTTGIPEKDETVYVLTGADGAVEKIIVSDWLKNSAGSTRLQDATDLKDVFNVKGDEGYTVSGSGLVWDAQGGDIYYQGSTDKALPVDVAVTYFLDGKAVSPQELAGKSGRVTIRFDYTNRQYEMVEINGKEEKIYVPFAMLTGMVLDGSRFTNVAVSSGKVFSDGSRTVVAGMAFPGLQENLDLDRDKLDVPDYVEVTADVTDFELTTTVTLAASDVFSDVNISEGDSLEDLTDSLDDLTDAMDQLMDGSSDLYDGLCTLLEKSGELVNGIDRLAAGLSTLQEKSGALAAGIDQIAAGTEALKSGSAELEAGSKQLGEGAATLSTGLDQLSGNSDTLNAGAEQVFETLLSSVDAQLAAAGAKVPALTPENYSEVLDGIIAAMPQGGEKIKALKASLDSFSQFYQGLQTYTAGVDQAAEGSKTLVSGAESLGAGADQLAAGVTELGKGAGALKESAPALTAGVAELNQGAAALKEAAPALTDGITELRDGAKKLSDGLVEFNEEGIEKLVDAVDGDLAGLMDRLRATSDAAKNYRSFAGIDENSEGQVKFVYRTAAIEAPEE